MQEKLDQNKKTYNWKRDDTITKHPYTIAKLHTTSEQTNSNIRKINMPNNVTFVN